MAEGSVGRAGPSPAGNDAVRPGPINSVINALRILGLLEDSPTIRVSDAAAELDVARSTAHRILTMLQHYGFVVQDPDSKSYAMGPVLLHVGLSHLGSVDIREIALPHLEALRDATGETCGLSVREGPDIVLVAVVDGVRPLRVVETIGTRSPAHFTAAGKAMLADLDRVQLRNLYPEREIEGVGGHPAITRKQLESALDEVRRLGYATNLGESGEYFVGIGSAVRDRSGAERGAITIALPESRVNENLGAAFGDIVQKTANALGSELP